MGKALGTYGGSFYHENRHIVVKDAFKDVSVVFRDEC